MEDNLIQNTDDWLSYRHKKIGASDSNIIMGVSRFKTPLELWEEKIKDTPTMSEGNFITEKGHRLEVVARNRYELETFLDWKPKIAEHYQLNRLIASLDGWNDSLQATWECKYMGKDKYETLKNKELSYRERIPVDYWPQIMHQAMVTNAKEVHFTGIVSEDDQFSFSFLVDDYCVDYIKKELMPKLFDFIKCIDNNVPPKVSEEDIVEVKDHDLKKKINRYKTVKKRIDSLKEEELSLKEFIFEESKKIHNKVLCSGAIVSQSKTPDKVVPDYKSYCNSVTSDEEMIANGFFKVSNGRDVKRISIKKV